MNAVASTRIPAMAARPRATPSAQRSANVPFGRSALGFPSQSSGLSARRSMAAASSKKPADFDELLAYSAEAFERSDKKAAIGGYLVGAIVAIFAAEWFMHLPLFNVLLGWPIQFLGLLAVPNLALRYYVNKDGDLWDDANDYVKKISDQLPGLGK